MRRSENARRLLVLCGICIVLLSSPACGGSDDDVSPAAQAAVFTPFANPPASGSISMQAGSASGLAFQIRVAVKDVSNLFGAAFRVTFNPNVARFDSADFSNSLLRGGGIQTQFSASPVLGHPSEIAVVATRIQNSAGTVPGVNVTNGDLVVLHFHSIAATSGTAINFGAPREACNPSAQTCGATTPVPTWVGGTLTAN